MRKICLNADGRGRIKTSREKQLFSYSSQRVQKKSLWKLAANFPFYGEKIMAISWRDKHFNFSGKLFFHHLAPLTRKLTRESRRVRKMLRGLATIIKMRASLGVDDKRMSSIQCSHDELSILQCQFEQFIFDWDHSQEDVFRLTSSLDKNSRLVMEGKKENGKYYQRLSFSIEKKKKTNYLRNGAVRLDFFISACSDNSKND